MIPHCRLCWAFTASGQARHENTIVLENAHFAVMPTLGQFVPGWLMIVSKTHHASLSEHSVLELASVGELLSTVRQLLYPVYGHCIAFEHGTRTRDRRSGCCIDHTHLHVVPCADERRFRELIPLPALRMINLESLGDAASEIGDYLLIVYSHDRDTCELIEACTPLPSQFLRQVLACVHGRAMEWDWRLHPCHENIRRSLCAVFPLVSRGSE